MDINSQTIDSEHDNLSAGLVNNNNSWKNLQPPLELYMHVTDLRIATNEGNSDLMKLNNQ